MKLLQTALCASVAAFAVAGAAHAETSVAFNGGVASQYVFRGIDQTGGDEEVELFGGADVSVDNFYAGTWISNTGPAVDNGIEYDIYAGYKPTVGAVALDLGVIFYGYGNSNKGLVNDSFNTVEFKAAGSVPAGPVTLGAAAYYSNDVASSGESSLYLELNAAYTIEGGPTINGAFGNFASDWPGAGKANSYNTWNVGITFPIGDHFGIDARYIGADDDAADFGVAFDGFVATAKATF